jgi:hypothetical protein
VVDAKEAETHEDLIEFVVNRNVPVLVDLYICQSSEEGIRRNQGKDLLCKEIFPPSGALKIIILR